MLTLSVNFAKCKADRIRNFAITDAENYVFVETLLTQEKKKLITKENNCNFFDKPVGNKIRKNDNIRKFITGQGDGYTNLKENYKIIAKALSKQQALDGADPS